MSYLNGALGTSAGAAATGAVTDMIVWPSAGCFSTSIAPIVMTPPGLFSTITFQPSMSDSAFATMRARMSGGVEADIGATMRIVPLGKVCASAEAGTMANAAGSKSESNRNFMCTP